MAKLIFDLQRFVYTISNSNTVYSGTSYDDRIADRGSSVSIDTGAGNDVIDLDPYYYGSVQDVTLTGGSGNDTFVIDPYNSNTISAVITDFTSNDVLVYDSDFDNSGNKKLTYSFESGNMVIKNNQSVNGSAITPTFAVTLKGVSSLSQISSAKYYRVTGWYTDGVSGNTQESSTFGELFTGVPISNSEASIPVYGTTDNESIGNSGGYVTVYAFAGNDTITHTGSHGLIFGGNGDDYIFLSYSDDDSVYGGAGNDTVLGIMGRTYIDGDVGNDLISIGGDTLGGAHTIRGGLGNDTIYGNSHSVGQLFIYESGDGYDLIGNYDSNDTLSIGGSAQYMRSTVGSNVVVSLLSGGAITLSGASDKTINIKGGTFVNIIGNFNKSSLVNGTSGNDTIYNTGDSVTVNAGAGNDSIYDSWGWHDTINAGSGNDTINLYYGNASFVNAGEGNDRISLYGGSFYVITVMGGAGNDTVCSSGNSVLHQYKAGDGNDVIYNWSANDTLQIGCGTGTYSSSVKGSNVIVTVGTGKISLMGAASLSAVNIQGKKVSPTPTNSWTLKGTTATYGTASKTLVTIKDVKSVDGLSLKNKVVTVSDSSLNQKKVTISSGYTLALGSDVTKSTSKAAGWTKSGSTATYKTASTTAGYKLTNNQISYVKKSGGATLTTVKGVKNINGLSVKNKIVTLKKSSLNSKVTLGGSYSFNLAAGDYKKTSVMGSASADIITSNGKNLSINGGKGNDTIKIFGSGTTVTGGKGNDVFIYSGGSGRITDFGTTDTLKIGDGTGTYSATTNGKNLIVTVGDNKLTLTGAANLSTRNIQGTIPTDDVKFNKNKTSATLSASYSEDSYTFGNGLLTLNAAKVMNDLIITGNKKANRIVGSEENDSILGGAGKDTILGGDGNDTIRGGAGNDSLDGGKGSDWFIYKDGDGDDTIVNYTEEDKISIASGSVSEISTSKDKKDIILTIGNGKITVKDAADKIVTYVAGGKTVGYRDGVLIKNKTATITNEYTKRKFSVADYGNSIREINAAEVTKALNITGSGNAESIIGTDGNDTITGGRGGDTLQGGRGADIFVYKKGDGNDVITDYSAEDRISIASGAVGDNEDYEGEDVIFSIGAYKITVKNGNGKTITFIDKDGKQNGRIYTKKSNMQTESLWFTEDDTNFANYDAQLGSIVKSSVSAYSFADDSALSSMSSLPSVTYSNKK